MKPAKNKSTQLNMKSIGSFVAYYKKMQRSQKTGMVFAALAVLMLPIAVFGTQLQIRNNSKAYETNKTSICKTFWVPDTKTSCQLINHCSDNQITDKTFKLESECLTSIGVKCQKLWWFDDDATNCKQKTFCGTYMYQGLKTFSTEDMCQKVLLKNK